MSKLCLKLYVRGKTESSKRAIDHLAQLCCKYLPGACITTVIDLDLQPEAAGTDRIYVTPTLVREFPLPEKRLVGALSDAMTILAALDLPAVKRVEHAEVWQPAQCKLIL